MSEPLPLPVGTLTRYPRGVSGPLSFPICGHIIQHHTLTMLSMLTSRPVDLPPDNAGISYCEPEGGMNEGIGYNWTNRKRMRMSANLTVVRTLLSNTGDVWQANLWPLAVRADHPQKLYQLPDEHLLDTIPVAKKISALWTTTSCRCGLCTPQGGPWPYIASNADTVE